MRLHPVKPMSSRRDFLKTAVMAGSLFCLDFRTLYASGEKITPLRRSEKFTYHYKTLPVSRLKDLQADIDRVWDQGKLSRNRTYRGYLSDMKFALPDDFQDAKSLVVMAVFTRLMYVNFSYQGTNHRVMLPPQYYDDGLTEAELIAEVYEKIIGKLNYRVVRSDNVFLKTLAVRSGLGKYGRNNICFVDGMGSFLTLYAFFTDYDFAADDWHDQEMMVECKDCSHCFGICPTDCIRREEFVIDVGRCIPLYNEVNGDFPVWIRSGMLDSLIGCMKCQKKCPVNEPYLKMAGQLPDITESETRRVLAGDADKELMETLAKKLEKFYPATSEEYFPVFTRNLAGLIG